MNYQFIFDENIPKSTIKKLQNDNYNIFSIKKNLPRIKDKEIIKLSKEKQQPIVTMDKDFISLIYHKKIQPYCIILIKIYPQSSEKIYLAILQVLKGIEQYSIELEGKFIIFDGKSLRIRNL